MNNARLMYCPRCESDREMTFEKRDEMYHVRSVPTPMCLPLWVCPTCGETVVDESYGDPCEKAMEKRKDGRDAED